MTRKPTVVTVSATEAQNRFGALIKRAYADEEHVIVERGGIPVVAIVPMQDYARLVAAAGLSPEVADVGETNGAASSARARLKRFLAEAHERIPYVADAEVEKDTQEAIDDVRRQQLLHDIHADRESSLYMQEDQ